MTLEELMLQPWTWTEPMFVPDPEGAYWEQRVAELPDFFVAAAGRSDVMKEAPAALRAFLESYVDRGENPPLPNPGRSEWVYAFGGVSAMVQVQGSSQIAAHTRLAKIA